MLHKDAHLYEFLTFEALQVTLAGGMWTNINLIKLVCES